MASAIVVSFPQGLEPPVRLEFGGPPPLDAGGWPTPFAIDWIDGSNDIVFHFNPRPEGVVVLNSRLGGEWGHEVVVPAEPFEPDATFRLRFDVFADRFAVFVDGSYLCDFPHRGSPETIVAVRSTIFLWRLEFGVALAPEGGGGWPSSPGAWVRSEKNPPDASPLSTFRLFGILSTWMEEDVVEASVANAVHQGVERVYIVDNGSSDATVARALEAGAISAGSFSTDRYHEAERIGRLQQVVDEVSTAEGDEHIWWLWFDADEFHHGPRGLTLRDYLASLDRRFRVVGARFFNHLPSGEPAYVEGRHPLDYQPLCYEIPVPNCDLGHSNHPLQRWDRDEPPIISGVGAHAASSAGPLVEPAVAAFFHHFPYRAEAATRARLELFAGADGAATSRDPGDQTSSHMRLRLRSLEAVYRQRWEDVLFFPPCPPGYVPELRRWALWVSSADREPARWY